LAHLSVGYPRLEGRLPTCYSPVRRFTQGVAPLFSLDLHVLGTPPAFVLSQDQTLQLRSGAPLPTRETWRVTSMDRRIRPGQHDDSRCPFDHAWDLFRAELLGKGALLFSFQRPGSSAGRPRLIREGLPIVKAARLRGRPPRSGRWRLDQTDLGETAAADRQEAVPVALEPEIQSNRLPVHPHGALRDQAPGLRGGGGEANLLQKLADPDIRGLRDEGDRRRGIRGALLEALREEARRAVGPCRPVESGHQLVGE